MACIRDILCKGNTMRFLNQVVSRLRQTSESEVFAMANLKPKKTGIEGVIIYTSTYFGSNGKRIPHGPRIKVYLGTSPGAGKEVTVTISKKPKILNGKLPANIKKDVFKFIDINFDVLMKYWEDQIDLDDFLAQIERIQ